MTSADETLEKALAHHRAGELAEAEKFYRQVLRSQPANSDALYLFGCLAHQTGKAKNALDLLLKAVGFAPNQAEYHHALGLVQAELKGPESAVSSYRQVLEIDPRHERAMAALADTLLVMNRSVEAISVYRQILQLNPESAQTWYSCGCAENARQEFALAKVCFARTLELRPDWLEARHNLGRALYELGLVNEAFAQFQVCSRMNQPGSEQSLAMMAVIAPGVPSLSNAEILQTRAQWASLITGQSKPTKQLTPFLPHVPLRIGYVSSFFHRDHWMKPVWGLINQHDRQSVRVYLFSDCAAASIQHGYQPHLDDLYFDTSQRTNQELSTLISELEIDVLVDLNGYSNMRRLPLFAERPAPVIIGWFNMYATTALDAFDFLIGDSQVVPPEEETFYSEKILRVSSSYLTFNVSYPVPPVASRQLGPFVFGALASQYKITDEVVEAWSCILRASPQSSLLVKNKQMESSHSREFLLTRFQKHGITKDRLQLEGPEPHFEFLRAYDRIDMALDTFPYNGGTTTTEAIWQGVPVLTFQGDRWAARTSASILRAAGLGEYVAADLAGYISRAIALAHNPGSLHELRPTMRESIGRSSVCDTVHFARQMEGLYRQACNRLTPDGH